MTFKACADHPHRLHSLILLWLVGALPSLPATAQTNEAEAPATLPVIAASAPATTPPAKAVLPPRAPAGGPTWQSLTALQRAALAPLQRDWDSLDSARKDKWLELAARFHALPAEEQARVQERMTDWVRLSPTERQQARVGYQGAQQLSADERKAKWEAFQALPAERRQELADKAASKKTQKAAPKPLDGAGSKSNLVPLPPKQPIVQAVAPSLLQAKPGATTVLITQSPAQPRHQMAGQPKLIADPSLVDPKTLLPRRAASGTGQ